MPNSMTEHSKALRQETSKQRRKNMIAQGGRRPDLLLDKEHAGYLEQLQRWFGSPHQPATATDVFYKLLKQAAKKLPKADN